MFFPRILLKISNKSFSHLAYTPPETLTTTKSPPVIDAGQPGKEEEKKPEFTVIAPNDRRIRFQLTGINHDRVVLAKPGENATLTCTAFGINLISPFNTYFFNQMES